jgi:hypothetical protein
MADNSVDVTISGAVGGTVRGETAPNQAGDMIAVKQLLNRIPKEQGGTKNPLKPPGDLNEDDTNKSGPEFEKLVTAIKEFQRKQALFRHADGNLGVDGRVDPSGAPGARTLDRLNFIANGQPPDPPSVSVVAKNTVEQPPGEEFLLAAVKDERDPALNDDLDNTKRKNKAVLEVALAALLGKLDAELEEIMGDELDKAQNKGVARQAKEFFFNNPTARIEKSFPDLDKLVESAPEFVAEAEEFEGRVLRNLQAQAVTPPDLAVDFHDLVTGNGPVWPQKREDRKKRAQSPEPGQKTKRLLNPLRPPDIAFEASTGNLFFAGVLGIGTIPTAKVVIGNAQGVHVSMKDFRITDRLDPKGPFEATLIYKIFDHFGINDEDCVRDAKGHGTEGQRAFWVLQHFRHLGDNQRDGGLFNKAIAVTKPHQPYVVVMTVTRTIKGVLKPPPRGF